MRALPASGKRGSPAPTAPPRAPLRQQAGWRLLALLALALLSASLRAQEDGTLLERGAQAFPPWESAPGLVPGETVGRYVPRAAYQAAVDDARFRLERLRYASDGLAVTAYLYGPLDGALGERPVVVFNRGGLVVGDVAPVYAPLFRRLAAAGYLVLAPMLRGSAGGQGRDDMGGDDVHDVLNVVPLLASLGADTTRLFLLGESRGGMMTFQALREGFPARAAAVWGAFTDLDAQLAADPRLLERAHELWPDLDRRRESLVEPRSALRWAEDLEAPLLLLHGGADEEVAPEHSERLARRLAELGRTCERVVYPDDGHLLTRSRDARDARVLAWFRRFSGTPPPPARTHYRGREISETMHWRGAEWLLRETREDEENAALFLQALALEPGWTVADVGCGNGFHTLRLARAVGPGGLVYGVDVQPPMLHMLEQRARQAGLDNVRPILGAFFDPWLPPASCDLILLADVYHEFSHPELMLAALREALKPDGALVLLEFRAEDPEVPIKKLHRMSRAQVVDELTANGFVLAGSFDELPWQHLLRFTRAPQPAQGRPGPAR